MKLKTVFAGFFSLVMAAALLAGCANQMEPAKKAIADVEAAAVAAGPDAAQYIPDQLQAVTTQITDLKMKFDQKDYKGVLAAAPGAARTGARPHRCGRQRQAGGRGGGPRGVQQ